MNRDLGIRREEPGGGNVSFALRDSSRGSWGKSSSSSESGEDVGFL